MVEHLSGNQEVLDLKSIGADLGITRNFWVRPDMTEQIVDWEVEQQNIENEDCQQSRKLE